MDKPDLLLSQNHCKLLYFCYYISIVNNQRAKSCLQIHALVGFFVFELIFISLGKLMSVNKAILLRHENL